MNHNNKPSWPVLFAVTIFLLVTSIGLYVRLGSAVDTSIYDDFLREAVGFFCLILLLILQVLSGKKWARILLGLLAVLMLVIIGSSFRHQPVNYFGAGPGS